MNEELLEAMATELNGAIRQVQSDDPMVYTAGLMRLQDLERTIERWRVRRVSRRGVLRGAGLGFVALSVKRDD